MNLLISSSLRVFESMIAVAFQIAFHTEKHVNNIFLFFKNYFWYQHIKTIQKVQTILNFSKKNIIIIKFCKTQVALQPQTASSCPGLEICSKTTGAELQPLVQEILQQPPQGMALFRRASTWQSYQAYYKLTAMEFEKKTTIIFFTTWASSGIG